MRSRRFQFQTLQAADTGQDRRNDSRIDVIMLTKNSERVLRRCLGSVYENVPVGNLIVVDGNSTDSTLSLLQGF